MAAPNSALSAREKEVLLSIARGHTNQEVADQLGMSPETVKTHVRHILYKLKAANRTHAVALGFARGLLKNSRHGS
jgi:DNA-binding CsgD family transcriptional regulator